MASEDFEHKPTYDRNGNLHSSQYEAHQANYGGSGGSGGGFIGSAMASFGPLLGILFLIPILISGLFQIIFTLLFKAKIVGRIIQSLIYGLVIGFFVYGLLEKVLGLGSAPFIVRALLSIVTYGLPSMWYYYSHYFTLKTQMEFKDVENKGLGMIMFVIFFCIIYGGLIVVGIGGTIAKFFYSKTMPNTLYYVPFFIAAIYYIVSSLKAISGASDLKKQETSPIIGAAIVLIITVIIPLPSIAKSAKFIADHKKVIAVEEAFAEQLTAGMTVVVTINEGSTYDSNWEPTGQQGTNITDVPYSRSSANATIVGHVKKGDILTVTGQVERDSYVPIEYNRLKGYIPVRFIGPTE